MKAKDKLKLIKLIVSDKIVSFEEGTVPPQKDRIKDNELTKPKYRTIKLFFDVLSDSVKSTRQFTKACKEISKICNTGHSAKYMELVNEANNISIHTTMDPSKARSILKHSDNMQRDAEIIKTLSNHGHDSYRIRSIILNINKC